MRGKRGQCFRHGRNERNIPAYAGKTLLAWKCPNTWTEHPRVCGENDAEVGLVAVTGGTSPRMRGKPCAQAKFRWWHRNIPAYAGKTNHPQPAANSAKEHPRVCGENSTPNGHVPIFGGTSPRMRGKLPRSAVPPLGRRNIPAYAGKTQLGTSAAATEAEHPRVCGENSSAGILKFLAYGTSPRMRGKPS